MDNSIVLCRSFVLVHSLQYMGVINFIGEYVEQAIVWFPQGEDGIIRLTAAMVILLVGVSSCISFH